MAHTAHVDTFARDNLPPPDELPEVFFELPELQYPARMNCAVELLDEMVAAGHGDRPAIHTLIDGRKYSCTYRQLLVRANQIARVLVEDLKLVPGNRVLLRGPNNPMMAACWLGVVKAGCIAAATMPLLRAKELEVIVDKARDRRGALRRAARGRARDRARSLPRPDAGPVLQRRRDRLARSGARGQAGRVRERRHRGRRRGADRLHLGHDRAPKGCMHFHRDVMAMCDAFPRSCLKPARDDVFCGTPPLAFTFGLGGMLCFPLRFGAPTVLMERLTPETLLETIRDFRATICLTAPTFYRQMAQSAGQYDPRA